MLPTFWRFFGVVCVCFCGCAVTITYVMKFTHLEGPARWVFTCVIDVLSRAAISGQKNISHRQHPGPFSCTLPGSSPPRAEVLLCVSLPVLDLQRNGIRSWILVGVWLPLLNTMSVKRMDAAQRSSSFFFTMCRLYIYQFITHSPIDGH